MAGCATPQPPKSTASAAKVPSKPGATRSTITQSPQRWQAVPAKADGAAVPGGRRHIVKRGETGAAIAKAYAVPWSRIAGANGLARDAVLQVGQPLFVPTVPPATPTASRTRPGQPQGFQLDIDDLVTGSTPAGEP
ncbi:MAG: LysM peptidoglycan-binding domain-containing protein, partial [Sandaracinobacteroides sp.]